jgi:hypothetical protein
MNSSVVAGHSVDAGLGEQALVRVDDPGVDAVGDREQALGRLDAEEGPLDPVLARQVAMTSLMSFRKPFSRSSCSQRAPM